MTEDLEINDSIEDFESQVSQKTKDRLFYDIYVELYRHADPPVDFGYLLYRAKIDTFGNKVIPTWEYYIHDSVFETVAHESLISNGIKDRRKRSKIILELRKKYAPQTVNPYKRKAVDGRNLSKGSGYSPL